MIISREKPELSNPHRVYNHIRKLIYIQDRVDREKEHFFVILLNTRNKVKCVDLISLGTVNASLVHPREVFRRAIREGAASILLAHNHPSGLTEPSEEDLKITKRLVEVGKIVGIEVIDHIIVGHKEFSFKERGLI
jgi:DNA repair protein RadC